jgi:uncharacterized membrane protein (DUF4010 family)
MDTDRASSPGNASREKRRELRFPVAAVLFVVAYFAARAGIETFEPRSLWALLSALLPVPFFAWLMWSIVRGVRGMDELERRIQLEALAIAFPFAILIAFAVGLLHLAGFHGTDNYDLPRLWPLLLLPYWFALWMSRRRYS